jgi:hypothetical protein
MASTVPSAYAGGTIKSDDENKWISIGMGTRMSFNAQERGAPNGDAYSNTFNINNARIYINGQVHKYIKFTFNTECFNCSVGGGAGFAGNQNIGLIDAIGKVEYNQFVNFWVGRTLVPTERGELNGPFYHPTFDGFRTPFFPNDNNNGNNAGTFGRDNGAVFFGRVDPGFGHLQYVASVFSGVQGGPNQSDSLMYAGRLTYNLLGDEFSHENPGYYTAGTYYGGYGDLLAIAVGGSHQHNGVGTVTSPQDYTGMVSDLLFEKLLGNNGDAGVFTLNAEFKRMWAQDLAATNVGIGGAAACFCQFSGSSEYVTALYLFPNKVGWGQFQPYGRFTSIQPVHNSPMREEWEYGLNYIISGFNARVSAYGRYGDIETKGFVGPGAFDPGRTGNKVDSFHVALQMQY